MHHPQLVSLRRAQCQLRLHGRRRVALRFKLLCEVGAATQRRRLLSLCAALGGGGGGKRLLQLCHMGFEGSAL